MIKNLPLVCLLLYSCACYMHSPAKTQFTKLALVNKLPLIFTNGQAMYESDSVCVTYVGDYIIYDLPHHYQEEVDDSIVFDGIRMEYFIYKKGQAHGYLFKTLQDTIGQKLLVDSIFKVKINQEDFELPRRFGNAPSSKVYNERHELEIVKLYPKAEKMIDSVYLYFSKQYATLGHSLCPQTDAQYGSTLYKISMFMEMEKDTVPLAEAAYLNGFKLITCEMIPLKVDNEKELDAFVARYKKQMAVQQ